MRSKLENKLLLRKFVESDTADAGHDMSFVVMKRAKVRAAASVESAVCGFLETDEVVVVGARTEVEHKQRLRIVDCGWISEFSKTGLAFLAPTLRTQRRLGVDAKGNSVDAEGAVNKKDFAVSQTRWQCDASGNTIGPKVSLRIATAGLRIVHDSVPVATIAYESVVRWTLDAANKEVLRLVLKTHSDDTEAVLIQSSEAAVISAQMLHATKALAAQRKPKAD